MHKRRIILAAVAAAALAAGVLFHRDRIDERAALAAAMPGVLFTEKQASPPCYRAATGETAFNSYDIVPAVRGYAGPLKTLVVLGPDGRIRSLRLLEHRETKNYVHYLESPAYLGRYLGKSIADPFIVDRDIDGISRATVSVEALARTVRESARIIAADVYGIRVAGGTAPPRGWWSGALYAALFAAAAAGYVLSRRGPGWQRYRDGVLAASIAVTGLLLSAPFSVLHVYNLLLLRPSSSVLWAVVTASTLLSVAVAGRAYCGWLCPFGALSELLARLPARKWSLPAGQDRRGRELKYLLLGTSAALVLATGRVDYGNFETYVTLFARHGTGLAWGLVVLALAAGLRVPRFWCRYLCPVAALTALFSRRDPAYVSRPDCPMGNPPAPETAECIRCNRCYRERAATQGP
jgi:hypothetical protein